MIYGEHLSADDITVKCSCGLTATVEVLDKGGSSCGWYCREHAHRMRKELRRIEKLAKAIVRRSTP